MSICPHCGYELTDGSAFCKKCGLMIGIRTSSASSSNMHQEVKNVKDEIQAAAENAQKVLRSKEASGFLNLEAAAEETKDISSAEDSGAEEAAVQAEDASEAESVQAAPAEEALPAADASETAPAEVLDAAEQTAEALPDEEILPVADSQDELLPDTDAPETVPEPDPEDFAAAPEVDLPALEAEDFADVPAAEPDADLITAAEPEAEPFVPADASEPEQYFTQPDPSRYVPEASGEPFTDFEEAAPLAAAVMEAAEAAGSAAEDIMEFDMPVISFEESVLPAAEEKEEVRTCDAEPETTKKPAARPVPEKKLRPAEQKKRFTSADFRPAASGKTSAGSTVPTLHFFGLHFLLGLPLVGIICAFVVIIRSKKENLRNYALARICWALLTAVLLVAAVLLINQTSPGLLDSIARLFKAIF